MKIKDTAPLFVNPLSENSLCPIQLFFVNRRKNDINPDLA
jgi:hypothetical protein